MPSYPSPTPIYHFTHIDNLSDLLGAGTIFCKNEMSKSNKSYKSSAFEDIQSQRQHYPVPVSPGGTIHDYVPFYFNSLSPMLYTIMRGNVDGVRIQDLVFFKSTVQAVEESGSKFAFTDGHGIMVLSEFYNDVSDLDQVPWEVINAQYWPDFPDGRRLRQSEFLVHREFSLNLVELVGVYNTDTLETVEGLVATLSCQLQFEIKREWYF